MRISDWSSDVCSSDLHAADIASAIGPGRAVVELGSGSSTKTPLLLDAIDPAAYVPVDISGDFLRDSAEGLAARIPGLAIYPVEADFTQRIELRSEEHTSELQSLMRLSYAVFCLKIKTIINSPAHTQPYST